MAFCGKCGAELADNVGFCGKCGQPVGAPATTTTPAHNPGASPTEGLAENVAGLLSYSLGWVTGIVFLLIDKRPFVRFHAAQSIVVFGGLTILWIIFAQVLFSGFWYGGGLGFYSLSTLLFLVLRLAGFGLWILLMVKAYQHEKFQIPVAAGIAQNIAGK